MGASDSDTKACRRMEAVDRAAHVYHGRQESHKESCLPRDGMGFAVPFAAAVARRGVQHPPPLPSLPVVDMAHGWRLRSAYI
jgi:hypothetical protein